MSEALKEPITGQEYQQSNGTADNPTPQQRLNTWLQTNGLALRIVAYRPDGTGAMHEPTDLLIDRRFTLDVQAVEINRAGDA